MAKLDQLSKAFDEAGEKAKLDNKSALKRSLIVINAIEKLKRQGIPVTKKAELDYILALRHVQKSSQLAGKDLLEEYRQLHGEATHSAPPPMAPQKPSPKEPDKIIRRTPEKNPTEFKKATELSRKIVAEVDALQKRGQAISIEKMEEYSLAKKFLEKYNL